MPVFLRSDSDFTRCAQVVQPLFAVLAQEIEVSGGKGTEISRRLGYDDINECFCGGRVKCVSPSPLQRSPLCSSQLLRTAHDDRLCQTVRMQLNVCWLQQQRLLNAPPCLRSMSDLTPTTAIEGMSAHPC